MPLAHIQWTVLIGGTGGKLCASDSSEVVNSMEERSLVSVALRKSTARSSRSRGREQTVISLLLRNSEMR